MGLILGLLIASSYFHNRKTSVPETTRKEFQAFTEAEARKFAEAATKHAGEMAVVKRILAGLRGSQP